MSAETPNRRGFFAFLAGCVASLFVAPPAVAVPKKDWKATGAWLKRRRPQFFGRYNSVAGAMANLGIDQTQQNRARIAEIDKLLAEMPGWSQSLQSADEMRRALLMKMQMRREHLLRQNGRLLKAQIDDQELDFVALNVSANASPSPVPPGQTRSYRSVPFDGVGDAIDMRKLSPEELLRILNDH